MLLITGNNSWAFLRNPIGDVMWSAAFVVVFMRAYQFDTIQKANLVIPDCFRNHRRLWIMFSDRLFKWRRQVGRNGVICMTSKPNVESADTGNICTCPICPFSHHQKADLPNRKPHAPERRNVTAKQYFLSVCAVAVVAANTFESKICNACGSRECESWNSVINV